MGLLLIVVAVIAVLTGLGVISVPGAGGFVHCSKDSGMSRRSGRGAAAIEPAHRPDHGVITIQEQPRKNEKVADLAASVPDHNDSWAVADTLESRKIGWDKAEDLRQAILDDSVRQLGDHTQHLRLQFGRLEAYDLDLERGGESGGRYDRHS